MPPSHLHPPVPLLMSKHTLSWQFLACQVIPLHMSQSMIPMSSLATALTLVLMTNCSPPWVFCLQIWLLLSHNVWSHRLPFMFLIYTGAAWWVVLTTLSPWCLKH
jgi:hypothetical protein